MLFCSESNFNKKKSIKQGIVVFRVLQSDAFVSKCNSSTLVLKNKIERIRFTYDSIVLKHTEDDYAWY